MVSDQKPNGCDKLLREETTKSVTWQIQWEKNWIKQANMKIVLFLPGSLFKRAKLSHEMIVSVLILFCY